MIAKRKKQQEQCRLRQAQINRDAGITQADLDEVDRHLRAWELEREPVSDALDVLDPNREVSTR